MEIENLKYNYKRAINRAGDYMNIEKVKNKEIKQ